MANNRLNFAYSTVATAPVPAASGTTMSFAAGGGTGMPAVPYRLVIWPTAAQPLSSNAEIVLVTAQTGDNVTAMTRQQEGTSARTIVVGDQADNGITKAMLDEILAMAAPVGSGTLGSVLFVDTGPVLAQDNTNFFWDNVKKYLGIGGTVEARLDVRQTSGFSVLNALGGFTTQTTLYAGAKATTDPGNGGLAGAVGDVIFELTANPAAAVAITGFNGIGKTTTLDSAVYPVHTSDLFPVLRGGSLVSAYQGIGTMPQMAGGFSIVQRLGTGVVNKIRGFQSFIQQGVGSGTVAEVIHFLAMNTLGTVGGTITNTYGIYIESQKTIAGTQTNTPYGVYQAGATDRNFYGGHIEAAGGVSEKLAPAESVSIPAGYSMIVARRLTIASGKKVTIGSGAILRIL